MRALFFVVRLAAVPLLIEALSTLLRHTVVIVATALIVVVVPITSNRLRIGVVGGLLGVAIVSILLCVVLLRRHAVLLVASVSVKVVSSSVLGRLTVLTL